MVPAPLFVIAPPGRSAAMVSAMLGRHPQAQDLPDLNLFYTPNLEQLLQLGRLSDGLTIHGLLRAVAQFGFGAQDEGAVEAAYQWLNRRAGWTGGELLNAFTEQLAPRLLVTPETAIGWRIDDLERLVLALPDARVLHLIEHPRAWCEDRLAALHGRLFIPPDFKDYAQEPPLLDPQIAWVRVHENLERGFADCPEWQYRRLPVEALLVQPEATLAALCDWLGLAVGPEILQAMQTPELSAFAGFGPASARTGYDERFLQHPWFERRLRVAHRLEGGLPWRPDGNGFAAEVRARASGYGYA